MIIKKIISLAMAALFLVQIAMPYAYSEEEPTSSGKIVTAVSVKNNRAISTETILSKIKTKEGDKFSQEVLNDDLKKLYATQYFTDISIDVQQAPGGVSVTFIVEEKSVIGDIIFKGNKTFTGQKLKATMKSKANEMLNLAVLAQDMTEIKQLYIKRGYPLVDVKYAIDTNKETNKSTITVTVEEGTHVKIKAVNITGNKAVKTGQIRRLLGTKPAWLFNTGIYKEETLQEDVDKIKMLYDDMGYLDTKVTPKMDYSKDGTELVVTFEIDEGRQYKVGTINVGGNLVFPEKQIRSRIKMVTGRPFSTRMLREDAVNIRQYYYQFGYMNASINVERSVNEEAAKIDLSYNIDAKEIIYVGKIEIRGNVKTKDIVIRRELTIFPGQKFDGEKMRRSKERIYNLGFFENVSFDTEPSDVPNVQNLIVNVKESKTGEFSFGGGYSSVDQLMGFAEITQRNFDLFNWPYFTGGGQNLSIRVQIGMVSDQYNISWSDPWIFGLPFLFGFDVYRWSHIRSNDLGWAYDETRTGGDLRLGKEFIDGFKAEATYRLEQVDISNLIDNAGIDFRNENGKNMLSSAMLDVTFDRRDNIFNPTKGYVLNGTIENAGGMIGGDRNFVKGTFSAACYFSLLEQLVLELKGRGGLASAYGSTEEVPVYERFYAGGANTIRGYKERSVSPRDSGSNAPVGGDAILLANAELTFPVYEKIVKGAVFYDVGNVWKESGDFISGGKLRSGAGIGVRVKTPIGPVKVDWGYPLVKNFEDKRNGEFYFSMSRGF